MEKVQKIKFIKARGFDSSFVPTYGTSGAACFDFYSPSDFTIKGNGELTNVGLNIAVEIPEGYAMLIFPRSSFGKNYRAILANGTGVIDDDYRGEIRLMLRSLTDRDQHIKAGDRIIQGMLIRKIPVEFEEVDRLSLTERGTGGIGSTGK